jgi:hypothetical protein
MSLRYPLTELLSSSRAPYHEVGSCPERFVGEVPRAGRAVPFMHSLAGVAIHHKARTRTMRPSVELNT